jgi:1-phosphofructokinase
MNRVLCITANPSIDRVLDAAGFRSGGVWRAAAVTVSCGGKGVNVARALRCQGVPSVNAGLLAGRCGRTAAERLELESLDARWTWVAGDGETRTCVHVVSGDGRTTVINEPGMRISPADWERLIDDVCNLAATSAAVAISGSLPPGCPEGGLARLIAAAGAGGRPVWVDTSGAALEDAIAVAPFGIKINAEEAASLLRRPMRSADDARDWATGLRRRGTARVAVTMGEGGAVLVTEKGAWHALPARVTALNPVGSVDCFLAGLLAAHLQGADDEDALRLATACGAANAAAIDIGHWPEGAVDGLAAETTVRALDG